MNKRELEELARVIGLSAYNAEGAALVGDPAPVTEAFYKRTQDVRIGDWVVERTTIAMSVSNTHYRPALDAVGRLIKITEEKVAFDDPDFVWDEKEEGRPHPTEKCVYIRTLDGREFRWTNASFLSIPAEYPLRGVEQKAGDGHKD